MKSSVSIKNKSKGDWETPKFNSLSNQSRVDFVLDKLLKIACEASHALLASMGVVFSDSCIQNTHHTEIAFF